MANSQKNAWRKCTNLCTFTKFCLGTVGGSLQLQVLQVCVLQRILSWCVLVCVSLCVLLRDRDVCAHGLALWFPVFVHALHTHTHTHLVPCLCARPTHTHTLSHTHIHTYTHAHIHTFGTLSLCTPFVFVCAFCPACGVCVCVCVCVCV